MTSSPAAAKTLSSGFQWLINDPEKTFKQAADHIIYNLPAHSENQ
jgi:hypothetical protein